MSPADFDEAFSNFRGGGRGMGGGHSNRFEELDK